MYRLIYSLDKCHITAVIIRSLAAVPSTKWASGIRTKIHVVLEGLTVCNVWKPMFYGKPYWYSFCLNSRIITHTAAIRFANDKYLRRISDPVLKFLKKIFSMLYLHLGYCIFHTFVWMKWPCWTYKMWYIYISCFDCSKYDFQNLKTPNKYCCTWDLLSTFYKRLIHV